MGTSTHNPGQSGHTPLVPSWLDDDGNMDFPDGADGITPDSDDIEPQMPPIPNNADPDRFRGPRGDFTYYVNSGGRDRSSLRKGVSNYVKRSVGGSTNATKRVGAGRVSSARFLSAIGAFAQGGVHEFEKFLNLTDIGNRSTSAVLADIADNLCPDGGRPAEGAARDAYLNALEENQDLANIPFSQLQPDQLILIYKDTVANTIFDRIINDIGNKALFLPEDNYEAEIILRDIKDYIRGAVSDAMARANISPSNISASNAQKTSDSIYRSAFDILEAAGE